MTNKKVMKKMVKKWGNCFIITFSPDECNLWGIKIGSIINLEDMVVENVIKQNSNIKVTQRKQRLKNE